MRLLTVMCSLHAAYTCLRLRYRLTCSASSNSHLCYVDVAQVSIPSVVSHRRMLFVMSKSSLSSQTSSASTAPTATCQITCSMPSS